MTETKSLNQWSVRLSNNPWCWVSYHVLILRPRCFIHPFWSTFNPLGGIKIMIFVQHGILNNPLGSRAHLLLDHNVGHRMILWSALCPASFTYPPVSQIPIEAEIQTQDFQFSSRELYHTDTPFQKFKVFTKNQYIVIRTFFPHRFNNLPRAVLN